MIEDEKIIINKDTLICDKGEKESNFTANQKEVYFSDKCVGLSNDNIAGKNIKSFGKCSISNTCKLEKDLMGQKLKWEVTHTNVMVGKEYVLTDMCECICPLGGKIKSKKGGN